MTAESGTRELADGRPAYRLVRRQDMELTAGLPGRSSGLATCRLVGGALGATHMALTLVSLVDGHVDEHVHSFEDELLRARRGAGALSRRTRRPVQARGMRSAPGGRAPRVRVRRGGKLARDGRAPASPRRQRHLLSRAAARRRRRAARRTRPAQSQPLPADGRRDGRRPGEARCRSRRSDRLREHGDRRPRLQRHRGEDARRPAPGRAASHDVHGRLPAGRGRAPARPSVRGVVLRARRRGRRRRER